eukprot:gb/GFBE01020012.1/.p1 GENE.gb/GFBE01020012.1/~~gb/GFBE01020012.1/.p1  ORF type:complete len:108 (+),score=35.96 gb/GFBE01020012.1/:1-324(+)
MDREEKVPQYRTIKRLQKNYLVRCGESLSNIVPGAGIKPASAIRRIEHEIKVQRQRLGQLTQEELSSQMEATSQKKVKNVQELGNKKAELVERIKQLEKQLLEYELL